MILDSTKIKELAIREAGLLQPLALIRYEIQRLQKDSIK